MLKHLGILYQILTLLALWSGGFFVFAQNPKPAPTNPIEFRGDISNKVVLHLLNFDYASANQTITLIHNHTWQEFYRLHLQFVRTMVYQDKLEMEGFVKAAEQYLKYLDTQKENPEQNALIAETLLERAIIKFLLNQDFSAGNDIRLAQRHLKQQRKLNPKSLFQYRASGLLKVALSTVPSDYAWVLDLMGWTANMEEGLQELALAVQPEAPLAQETQLFLYYIERNLLEDEFKAHQRIDSLHNRHPEILMINYLLASNLIDRRENLKARELLLAYTEDSLEALSLRFPYLRHLLGRTFLYDLELPEARTHFNWFLSKYQGKLFKQDARFRMAMAYALEGRINDANRLLNLLINIDAGRFGEDKYAKKRAYHFLKWGYKSPDMTLQRARYLYDGGYLERAKTELDTLASDLELLNMDMKCELYYRYGRIFQAMGQVDKALAYYKLAFKQPSSENRWMAAYSTYYTGQLYEEAADWHKARYHYKLTLGFEAYDYQEALEQKAKAGLARIQHKSYEPDGG